MSIENVGEDAGLDYWDINTTACSEEYLSSQLNDCPNSRLGRCLVKKRIKYKPGEMVIHRGALLHAVGNAKMENTDKGRITMQAFSVFCNGKWLFFF